MAEKRIITDAAEAAAIRNRLVDVRRIKQIVMIATEDQPRLRGYKSEATLVISAWASSNKDCHAVFKQLPEPPLTVHFGPGTGVNGLIQLATSHAQSLLESLAFPARAHLQFLSIPTYPPERGGPKIFCLLTLCEEDAAAGGSVLNHGKVPLVLEFDAAGDPLMEFRLEPGAGTALNEDLKAHLVRNEQMWRIWTSMGVTEQTHLTVDFHFYATRQESAERLADLLKGKGMKISMKSKRMFLVLKGWEITASESTCWTLERLQMRTREVFDEATKQNINLEGAGALMPGAPK